MSQQIEEMLICREKRGGCGRPIVIVRELYTSEGQKRRGWMKTNSVVGKIKAIHCEEFDDKKFELVTPTLSRVRHERGHIEERCRAQKENAA